MLFLEMSTKFEGFIWTILNEVKCNYSAIANSRLKLACTGFNAFFAHTAHILPYGCSASTWGALRTFFDCFNYCAKNWQNLTSSNAKLAIVDVFVQLYIFVEWRMNELLLLVLSNQCKACSVVHHNHTTTTQSQPQPQLHNHTLLCHHCCCIPVQLLYIQSEAKVSYPLSTKKIQKVKRNQQQEIRVTLSALWLVGRNIITQIQKYKNSPRCTFFVLSCFCRNS